MRLSLVLGASAFALPSALVLVAALPAGGADAGTSLLAERLERVREAARLDLESEVSLGALETVSAYVHDIEKVGLRDPDYVERKSAEVRDLLSEMEAGRDPIASKRGMFWRGYRSRYSTGPLLYSIYVPKDYDPEVAEPLVVTLHGGSSNHNVWLATKLGNNIPVKDFWPNHRTEFRARRHPGAIVVAPDGLGQVRWRWMGEQDVLDVIDDVRRNYRIDSSKIFLSGLSNGGIGAYTVGLKHAWRFAAVLPLAGVTDWLGHHEAEGRWRPYERTVLRNESAISYAENAYDTHLRFFHGEKDPGFSVEQARAMADRLKRLGIPFRYHEFEGQGHDLGYVLWRKLLVMRYVNRYSRRRAPPEVRLVTTSSRASRQFWVVLDERQSHVDRGRLHVRMLDHSTVEVDTENARRFSLLLDESPTLSPVTVEVDGREAYSGPVPPGGRLTLALALEAGEGDEDAGVEGPAWEPWDGSLPKPGTRKVAGLSGPLGDVNYEPQVHVYGTLVPRDEPILKRAAVVGARAWMHARDYSSVRHPVIPDSELTREMTRSRAVVLYGNARNNSVLAEIGDGLPIRVGKRWIGLRGTKLRAYSAGARFVCPNPLAPGSYLVVQAGVSAKAVEDGNRLPIYLGDYIVYNAATTRRKAFMVLGGRKEIEGGFFTEDWKLPPR